MAASDGKVECEGVVTHELGNGMFRVSINKGLNEVLCTLAGKIKYNNIRIITGDTVKIELGCYDLTKGRIVFRKKS